MRVLRSRCNLQGPSNPKVICNQLNHKLPRRTRCKLTQALGWAPKFPNQSGTRIDTDCKNYFALKNSCNLGSAISLRRSFYRTDSPARPRYSRDVSGPFLQQYAFQRIHFPALSMTSLTPALFTAASLTFMPECPFLPSGGWCSRGCVRRQQVWHAEDNASYRRMATLTMSEEWCHTNRNQWFWNLLQPRTLRTLVSQRRVLAIDQAIISRGGSRWSGGRLFPYSSNQLLNHETSKNRVPVVLYPRGILLSSIDFWKNSA